MDVLDVFELYSDASESKLKNFEKKLSSNMDVKIETEKQFMIRENNAPNYECLDFDIVINNKYKKLTRKKVRNIYDKSIISR